MLIQRCTLDQHRLILPVSVSKPLLEQGNFIAQSTQTSFRGLVDTGAQRTVVSESVIANLGLVRTGHMEFGGLHGSKTHSRYLASIGIWAHRIDNKSGFKDITTNELSLYTIEAPFEVVNMNDNTNFDLILGFDVLKLFSFRFDCGDTTFEITVSA